MKLIEIYNCEIDLHNDISTACLFSDSEVAILTCAGDVLIYDYQNKSQRKFFDLGPKRQIGYRDGGFDATAASSIYVMDNIVVVVNDYNLICEGWK